MVLSTMRNSQPNDVYVILLLIGCLQQRYPLCAARHWIPKIDDVVHNVRLGHPDTIIQQNIDQPLRFKIVYEQSINAIDKPKSRLIKQLIPAAVNYFHQTYLVRKSSQPIKLQRMCKDNSYFLKDILGKEAGDVQFCKISCVKTVCGPIVVPESYMDDCRVCNEHGQTCIVHKNLHMAPIPARTTDFILFVSSIPTTHCHESNIVAYASYCQQEHSLNRPVAGFVNLCPGKLDTGIQGFESLLSTVKHEIYHALGFSVGLFAFYRDKKGKPLTERNEHGFPVYNNVSNVYQWSQNVVKSYVRNDWSVSGGFVKHKVFMLVTPTVQKEVRNHFNCKDLEGAELENQGGEGTALTHWEKRVFENEAMTGTYTQHPVFSRITLALMEDTGWYKANYKMAENLDWGKNLGCFFVKNNCRAWIARRIEQRLPTAPFCATLKQSPLHMRCTHTKLSLALCNLVKYNANLPREFQYFDRLGKESVDDIYSYGGAVELADFCPFYQKFTLTEEDGRKRGTTCTLQQNSPQKNKNYALEKYSAQSKCVEHGRHWVAKKGLLTRTMLDWGSGCYEYECHPDGILFIISNGKKYACAAKGDRLQIAGLMDGWQINGSLVCPACSEFCSNPRTCANFNAKSNNHGLSLQSKIQTSEANRNNDINYQCIIFMIIMFIITIYK